MSQLDFTRDAVAAWARLRPNEDLESLALMQRLVWCGRRAEEILERTAQGLGFRRRGDYEVMALLRRSEPNELTPIEVAQKLVISPSGVTTKVDRLQRLGFLERLPDGTDRRIVRLALTDEGRSRIDEAFATSLLVYERMLSNLDSDERVALDRGLIRVLSRLDEMTGLSRPWA